MGDKDPISETCPMCNISTSPERPLIDGIPNHAWSHEGFMAAAAYVWGYFESPETLFRERFRSVGPVEKWEAVKQLMESGSIKEPVTVYDDARNANVCNLCGSADITSGYGMAGGGGPGVYNFCNGCQRVLDKSPDGVE